jgi:hypothetical protein
VIVLVAIWRGSIDAQLPPGSLHVGPSGVTKELPGLPSVRRTGPNSLMQQLCEFERWLPQLFRTHQIDNLLREPEPMCQLSVGGLAVCDSVVDILSKPLNVLSNVEESHYRFLTFGATRGGTLSMCFACRIESCQILTNQRRNGTEQNSRQGKQRWQRTRPTHPTHSSSSCTCQLRPGYRIRTSDPNEWSSASAPIAALDEEDA